MITSVVAIGILLTSLTLMFLAYMWSRKEKQDSLNTIIKWALHIESVFLMLIAIWLMFCPELIA